MSKRNIKWQPVPVPVSKNQKKSFVSKNTQVDNQTLSQALTKKLWWLMWIALVVGTYMIYKGIVLVGDLPNRPEMDKAVPYLTIFFGYLFFSMGAESAVTNNFKSLFKVEKESDLYGWKIYCYKILKAASVVASFGFKLMMGEMRKREEKQSKMKK